MEKNRGLVSASILNADFSRLGAEVERAVRAGADLLHLDIMDGHFVPNLSFGPQVPASLRPHTGLDMEVHLMISDPERYWPAFREAGGDLVLFHVEVIPRPLPLLAGIRAGGARAGLVVNPQTPVETLFPFLAHLDQVLVMSVQPGFGGQSFLPATPGRLARLDGERRRAGHRFLIEVDGGVNAETGRLCRQAGADILVAGTYLFGAADIGQAVRSLK